MFLKLFTLCLFLLTGCASFQTVHWGAWSEWSEWKNTKKSETRTFRITSEPPNCEAFVNDKLAGLTPLDTPLSYPILQSERQRKKYQTTHSNWSPEWLILNKGDKPGTSKVVDSEKEDRYQPKAVTHEIVVKKQGYRTASKSVSIEEPSANFVLKEKPCLYVNNVAVTDNSELSVAQKLYETVFGKKYAKDIKLEEVREILISEKHLQEIFNFSAVKGNCDSLNCDLAIGNEYTDMRVTILNSEGKTVAEASSRFKTGFERKEFFSGLKTEVGKGFYNIYKTLCEE